MPTNHREQLADLLDQTTMDYVDHQEDDLGKPVLETEMYLAGIDYIVRLLSVAVGREVARGHSPSGVVDTLLTQIRLRIMENVEFLQDNGDIENLS